MNNLNIQDLTSLRDERIGDAEALFEASRYPGAFYICGYAIELGLKKKICEALGWSEYICDSNFKFLKTHNFEVLLHFSGVEKKIKKEFIAEWSVAMKWNPEIRYSSEKPTLEDAKTMIESSKIILGNL